MVRITRKKAAEILGLSRQTISNYIEQGLIGSCVGEHGILYVNSEDVDKYAKKYKMLAANEKMIDDKLKEVEAHKHLVLLCVFFNVFTIYIQDTMLAYTTANETLFDVVTNSLSR